jgi:predicted O-methyltransferase YrrM
MNGQAGSGVTAFSRATAFASRVVWHPSWAKAHVANLIDKKYDNLLGKWPPESNMIGLSAALQRMTGAKDDEIAAVIAAAPRPRRDSGSALYGAPDGSTALLDLLYACCRLRKPDLVIEVGVAHGFSSAAILNALDELQHGVLYSIDLPHLHPRAEAYIGQAVEERLRSRWNLSLGPSATLIPKLSIERGRSFDIALHDGTHTLRGQLADYALLWEGLKPGGLLISDDAGPAAALFGCKVAAAPFYIDQPPKPQPIAIFEKPSR